MSAFYVRQLFRQWCGEVAAFEGIPFYDTINREQNPSDPVWWSCLFIALENENTYCDDEYREVGQIVLIVSAQPGIGDADAVQAIEIIIPALLGKDDPANRLVLDSWEPPFEDTTGSADREYRIGVVVNYSYSND